MYSAVFPTPVGVFPDRASGLEEADRLPHTRGVFLLLAAVHRIPARLPQARGGAGSDSPTASTPYRDPGRNSPSP